ncbi:MAG TPA: AAA family ATPase [Mycobacteriales bacterium]|nr:AAA family ATPase [Mycobacteriales bacterium]
MIHPNTAASPLVIALEGPCYAGKTTLAAALARTLCATVAPDYAAVAPLPPFPPHGHGDVRAALCHFLGLERHRAAYARAAARPIVLCDRSPLTLISYEIGMAALGVPHDPALAVAMFSAALDDGTILAPDAYLYLTVTPPMAAARRAARGPVADHLSDLRVQRAINAADRFYLDQIHPSRRLVLDGATPLPKLVTQATAFIADLQQHRPPGRIPGWHTLLPTTTSPVAAIPAEVR